MAHLGLVESHKTVEIEPRPLNSAGLLKDKKGCDPHQSVSTATQRLQPATQPPFRRSDQVVALGMTQGAHLGNPLSI